MATQSGFRSCDPVPGNTEPGACEPRRPRSEPRGPRWGRRTVPGQRRQRRCCAPSTQQRLRREYARPQTGVAPGSACCCGSANSPGCATVVREPQPARPYCRGRGPRHFHQVVQTACACRLCPSCEPRLFSGWAPASPTIEPTARIELATRYDTYPPPPCPKHIIFFILLRLSIAFGAATVTDLFETRGDRLQWICDDDVMGRVLQAGANVPDPINHGPEQAGNVACL